ncbi:MAG: hypothetical protein ACTHLP_07310 [Rhizobiaceae bacterium]
MSATSDEIQNPNRSSPDLLLYPIRRLRVGRMGVWTLVVGVGIGWAALFIPWPTAISASIFHLGLMLLALLFLGAGPLEILSAVRRYPRLELVQNVLTVNAMLYSRRFDLARLGRAYISQSDGMIFLDFVGLEEEQALRAAHDSRRLDGFTAKRSFCISSFVGHDLAEAQKLADRINSLRPPVPPAASQEDNALVLLNLKRRNRRNHMLLFGGIMAISIIAAFARSHGCGHEGISDDGTACVVYADVIKKIFVGD